MVLSNSAPAKHACHNCRRKRWKCDRSLPSCRKCQSSNSECLGYGKLFIWNRGVASRGKMMGKTFDDESTQQDMEAEERKSALLAPSCASQFQGNDPAACSPDQSLVAIRSVALQSACPSIGQVQWPIVDAFFQGLNDSSRRYLDHFIRQLCADMVPYDGPGNPLRDLVPATQSFPYLFHIIIANAAHHVYNISRDQAMLKNTPLCVGDRRALAIYDTPTQNYHRDALEAKQKALKSLAQSITVVTEANFDWLLSTILLFINYDLVESGKDQWKIHMEGARKLVSFLGSSSPRSHQMSRLRISQLSDYLVFYILGSTFRVSYSSQLFPPTLDVRPILEFSETNGYLSCPAPLLSIMLESFELSDSRVIGNLGIEQEEKLKSLVQRTLAFDPAVWLSTIKPVSSLDDPEKRFHIASAHRSAVCIYLARFIPYKHPLLDPSSGQAIMSLASLATDIVYHISYITPKDGFFKSLNWPLFLAGAETDDPAERVFIAHTLDTIYDLMRWGYIQTNKKILETIWELKAHGIACWVTEVTRNGTELLIV